jgi:hypothetical protein
MLHHAKKILSLPGGTLVVTTRRAELHPEGTIVTIPRHPYCLQDGREPLGNLCVAQLGNAIVLCQELLQTLCQVTYQ